MPIKAIEKKINNTFVISNFEQVIYRIHGDGYGIRYDVTIMIIFFFKNVFNNSMKSFVLTVL